MSDCLNELTEILEYEFSRMTPDNDNKLFVAIGDALGVIHSLGENARRMLQIGIVQDDLVKLGFERNPDNYQYTNYDDLTEKTTHVKIVWNFYSCFVYKNKVGIAQIFYKNLNWQQDLLAKVRELIGDES